MDIELFACVATQTSNGSCILVLLLRSSKPQNGNVSLEMIDVALY
jgi:hypothetical protein